MPFFDDTGFVAAEERSPLWAAFTTAGGQLERFVLLNLAWALQLVPAYIALAFDLPLVIKLLLTVYTLAALPVATAALYRLVLLACDETLISPGRLTEELPALLRPALRALTPLLGAVGFLAWAADQANRAGAVGVSAVLQVMLLLLLLTSAYWGPIIARQPEKSAWAVLVSATALVRWYPARSLLIAGMSLLTLVIGAISIGGLFLIIPVLVALLQEQMVRTYPSVRQSTCEDATWAR